MIRRLVRSGLRLLLRLLAFVLQALPWRLVRITNPDRIGHLAGEIDCLLKERILGRLSRRIPIVLLPTSEVCNEALLRYWSRRILIVRSRYWFRLLDPLYQFPALRYKEDTTSYLVAMDSTAEIAEINRLWGDRAPLLSLAKTEVSMGERFLARAGLDLDEQFVCFHVREGGYSPRDEHLHSFRNGDVASYIPAMEALAAKGLWCVRLGDPTMTPLPRLPRVIDYAHYAERADWLDVFLCARAKFYVGNTSGLFLVALAFGVPCCLTNIAPFSAAPGYGPARDLGIPKLIWSSKKNRLLTFPEILATPTGNFRFSELYERAKLSTIENDPDEVAAVVLEMYDRVTGGAQYTAEDEHLQVKFRQLLRHGHHAYGGASRVGRDFLRKYAHLMGTGVEQQ